MHARRTIPPADPALAVAQAIPKGERGQLAVELMTEVGVDVVIPWAAQRCVVRWSGERGDRALGRWRSTAREAGKQARRARFPEVTGPAGLPGLTARVAAAACAMRARPGRGYLAWRARRCPAPGRSCWSSARKAASPRTETSALAAAGAVSAHLGPTVLRASTAGAVAAAVLLSRLRPLVRIAHWSGRRGDAMDPPLAAARRTSSSASTRLQAGLASPARPCCHRARHVSDGITPLGRACARF